MRQDSTASSPPMESVLPPVEDVEQHAAVEDQGDPEAAPGHIRVPVITQVLVFVTLAGRAVS